MRAAAGNSVAMMRRELWIGLLGGLCWLAPAAGRVAAEEANPTLDRWAILATPRLQETGLPDLVAAKLSQTEAVELVERERMDALLGELELAACFAAEAAGERLALGRLVPAEALLLLSWEQTVATPPTAVPAAGSQDSDDVPESERFLRLVIADCRYGVRLRVELIPFDGSDLEEAAAACREQVEQVRHHFAGGLREVIAVPHFLSQGLTHDHDHLQAGYAYLLQTALMSVPGVAVVETEEARAIGRERELAGAELEELPVPLYVEGEFEVAVGPADVEPEVRLGLRVSDGQTIRLEIVREGLSLAELTELLRGPVCREIVRLFQEDPRPGLSRRQQQEMLIQRAGTFSRYDAYEQAIGLREAALLLEPDELAARIEVINDYLQWRHARTLALKMARSESSAERPGLADAERAASAAMTAAHLQIVGNHLEYLLRRRMLNLREAGRLVHDTVSNLAFSGETRRDYLMRLYALFPGLDPHLREGKHVMRANWKPRRFAPAAPKLTYSWEQGLEPSSPMAQYLFWTNSAVHNIFRPEVSQGEEADFQDPVWDDLFRFVTEIADPDLPIPALAALATQRSLSLNRRLQQGWLEPASVRRFYARLAATGRPVPEFHAQLGMLALRIYGHGEPISEKAARCELEALELRVRELDPGVDEYYWIVNRFHTRFGQLREQLGEVLGRVDQEKLHPLPENPVPTSQARLRVRFEPIEGTQAEWTGLKQCGHALDVAWHRSGVFAMGESGRLQTLYRVPPDRERVSSGYWVGPPRDQICEPVFDGENFWIARQTPAVYLVSPTGDVLGQAGTADGLPPGWPGSRMYSGFDVFLHPIEPGKSVVIGRYGRDQRLWCALVSFAAAEPGGRPQVNVFHVANRQADEADPHGTFRPIWLAEHVSPGNAARRLLLVGRGTDVVMRSDRVRPLAIDLESLEVSIFPVALPYVFCSSQISPDRRWAAVPGHDGPRIVSLVGEDAGNAPEQDTRPSRDVRQDRPRVFWHEDAFYQVGQHWHRLDPQTRQVEEVARTMMPWQEPFERSDGSAHYAVSAHHGLVGWTRGSRLYRAVIEPRPTAEDELAVRYAQVPASARTRHHRAVEAIRRLGGSVDTRWGYSQHVYWRDGPHSHNDPDARLNADQHQWRTIVYLDDTWRGGDAALDYLKDLYQLRDLYFVRAEVTDEGLQTVGQIDTLQSLYLVESMVTNAGLEHLRQLEELVYVRLEGTPGGGEFDARGLSSLAGLPNLRRLTLYGAGFDDATFAPLEELPRLRRVALLNTHVSDPAMQEFTGKRRLVSIWRVRPQVAWTFLD